MKVIWEIEDGYTGPSRPHTTEIEDDDLTDCGSIEEREAYIVDSVIDDFERTISWREIRRER